MKRIGSLIVTVLMAFSLIFGVVGCGGTGKTVISIDGGGALGDFNTSRLTGYNTLEVLAKEYMQDHLNVEIKIERYSMGGRREDITARLQGKTAPDIIFQVPTSLAEDLGKDWYVQLNDYLEEPNPYNDNKLWKEIYDPSELELTKGPDGNFYFVGLERSPVGIAYNKELFARAGITKVPETYSEFLVAQQKLSKLTNNVDGATVAVTPFLPEFDWYKIILETSLFAPYIEELDTIREDGLIDTEEFCKAYTNELWNPRTDTYRDYIFFSGDKTKYYPSGWDTHQINRESEFARGNIGMYEINGQQLFSLYNDSNLKDKVGYFGYPTLDLKSNYLEGVTVTDGYIDYENIPDEYKIPENERYGVRRGFSGISTAWWITNTAVSKGSVEECVDFLMYLTSPTVNNRLIGDKGNSLPLSSDAPVPEILQPLVEQYNEDLLDEKMLPWGAVNANGKLNKEFSDSFTRGLNAYRNKIYSGGNPETIITLNNNLALASFQNDMANWAEKSVASLMTLNGWSANRWN